MIDYSSMSNVTMLNYLRVARGLLQYFYDNDVITRKDLSLSYIALDHVIAYIIQHADITLDE